MNIFDNRKQTRKKDKYLNKKVDLDKMINKYK